MSDKRLSSRGLALLIAQEGFRQFPYDDQTGKSILEWCKGATIGFGHLISREEWDLRDVAYLDEGLTREQASKLFQEDLLPFTNELNHYLKNVDMSQEQFDALMLLVFNIGGSNFSASSVLKMLDPSRGTSNYTSLEEAWKAWNKSQGKVSKGLMRRRNVEWRLFSKGQYS